VVVAGGGNTAAPPPPDPTLTPQSEAERAAVRDALKQLREKKEPTRYRNGTTLVSARAQAARVTVQLPADARLFIDNVACPLTSSTRSFNTPALQQGRDYYYTLRAEVTRNGQTRVQSQRVTVAAGRHVRVEFNNLSQNSRQVVRR
jgi:uncharacterized protein (TIGR03000 family)